MKSKLIIASMLAVFSAQSFATGTIQCTGKTKNAEGKKAVVEMFIAVDYDLTSVGGVTVNANTRTDEYVDLTTANAKIIAKKDGYKITSGSKKNNLSLDYNTKAATGKAVITLNNVVTTSDVVCNADL